MVKTRTQGFSLIELLVILALAAILITLGMPALRDFIATSRMSAAVNDLVTDLYLARSEAMKTGQIAVLCPSSDWNTELPVCNNAASLADGWIVMIDPDDTALVANAHAPLPSTFTLRQDLPSPIAFDKDGQLLNANPEGEINLLLCDERGDHDTGAGIAGGRWINIRSTGRSNVYAQRDDVQGMLGGC